MSSRRRDEQLVGGGALRPGSPRAAADRQQLRHEAALGADRHDHGVLDLLRLDQAEHLGAEILRPVGPADAAARHLAEAQMHALDARRIDEDLVERPRQRQAVELAAVELDGDGRLRLAAGVELVEVGAQRRLHRVDEVAQDAVLVEALDRLQRGLDRARAIAPRARPSSRRDVEPRIEARVEQRDDVGRDARMLDQRRPHVVLRIGHADLAQEARDACGSAPRRATAGRRSAPARCSRRSRRRRASPPGSRLPAAAWRFEIDRAPPSRAPASCRGTRRRAAVRPARSGRSARRPRGSPCSPAPARAPTAGSAGRSSTPSGRPRARRVPPARRWKSTPSARALDDPSITRMSPTATTGE